MSIVQLSKVDIPRGTGLARAVPDGCEVLSPLFWENYDTRTLFYDVVFDPARKRVRLYAPRLWGLESSVQEGTFIIDDAIYPIDRFRKFRHIDIIEFKNVRHASTIKIVINGHTVEHTVNRTDKLMIGVNGIFTLSKNNKLEWIKTWAKYHVDQHGADAVVIADNGSTDYTLEELDQTLRAVDGLKQVRVFGVDAPFGPSDSHCSNRSIAKYLQVGMLNISRERFFNQNAVMLNVDIDELVVSRKRHSVFAATRRKIFGHMTFDGEWVHSKSTNKPSYQSHFWRQPSDRACPTKFTIASRSPFRRLQLQVHNILHVHRKFFKSRDDFYFLHFRQISNSWKYARNIVDSDKFVHDTEVENYLKMTINDNE